MQACVPLNSHGTREGALNCTRPPSHGVKGRRKGGLCTPPVYVHPLTHSGAAPVKGSGTFFEI